MYLCVAFSRNFSSGQNSWRFHSGQESDKSEDISKNPKSKLELILITEKEAEIIERRGEAEGGAGGGRGAAARVQIWKGRKTISLYAGSFLVAKSVKIIYWQKSIKIELVTLPQISL